MNVKIICVGKLKEQYLRDACGEYLKRLSRFANVTVTELQEYRLTDNPSPAQLQKAVSEESMSILREIDRSDYVFALDVGANQLTSEDFSRKIRSVSENVRGCIVFIIGGSNGFSDDVRVRADMRLGFSKMTFPHQLFRVMLLEQIYRAYKIAAGEKYHK